MTRARQVVAPIQLRGIEAWWVLGAHAYALIVPFVLVAAVALNWDYLGDTIDAPALLFVAAALFAAGAAFEVAQNAADNWYLTPETPSAHGVSMVDLLFYWTITGGQAAGAVAIAGDQPLVVVVAIATVVALPIMYLQGSQYFIALGFANLLGIGLAFGAFGSTVVFLQLLMVAATMYFFEALLRTGAQWLHGFTTLSASSGVWFLIWAIADGEAGNPTGWVLPIAIALIAVVVGAALWPTLLRQSPSTRYAGARSAPGTSIGGA
jgi:hypothetical protein